MIRKKIQPLFLLVIFAINLGLSSCESFVDAGISSDKITLSDAFGSESSANSVIEALYSYPGGTSIPFPFLFNGIYADELKSTQSNAEYLEFGNSSLSVSNTTLETNFWTKPYALIRQANLAIKGIAESQALTDSVKAQLTGEAKFMRAYSYFILVNAFGDVPLNLSSDDIANAYSPRTATDSIWAQIKRDLTDAEKTLAISYPSLSTYPRTRANKLAATALLARVSLYTGDWQKAENEATKVIENTAITYKLSELNKSSSAFSYNSNETILQIANISNYSTLGIYYLKGWIVLYPGFAKEFETGDLRKTYWTDSVAGKYYRVCKYRNASSTNVSTNGIEYTNILRLNEQYLIRAEARAHLAQSNSTYFTLALNDLNTIRKRAGLSNSTASGVDKLIESIAKERKMELFGENHRWYDLKRTNKANELLSTKKPSTWTSTNVLFPIPIKQINLNNNLKQNPGYE